MDGRACPALWINGCVSIPICARSVFSIVFQSYKMCKLRIQGKIISKTESQSQQHRQEQKESEKHKGRTKKCHTHDRIFSFHILFPRISFQFCIDSFHSFVQLRIRILASKSNAFQNLLERSAYLWINRSLRSGMTVITELII